MARDPELPRFGGLFSGLGIPGQSCNALPTKAVHIFVPSQHLIHKVLHLVCEFRPALTNERNDVDILRRRMDASVLLIKELGGGWNVADLPQL
jgi:hypothetical protein